MTGHSYKLQDATNLLMVMSHRPLQWKLLLYSCLLMPLVWNFNLYSLSFGQKCNSPLLVPYFFEQYFDFKSFPLLIILRCAESVVFSVHDENWFHIILFSYLNQHSNQDIDIVDVPQHNMICYVDIIFRRWQMHLNWIEELKGRWWSLKNLSSSIFW